MFLVKNQDGRPVFPDPIAQYTMEKGCCPQNSRVSRFVKSKVVTKQGHSQNFFNSIIKLPGPATEKILNISMVQNSVLIAIKQ